MNRLDDVGPQKDPPKPVPFADRSPIVPNRPICDSLSTINQICHAATYRYYNMHIEWQGESYRLVENELGNKYGPWAAAGEMSTVGDYGTDGHNIYQIMPIKPKRINIIFEVSGVGIVEFKPNWYYFRDKDKHMLIYGSESAEGPLGKEIKLRNYIARADFVLVEEMT